MISLITCSHCKKTGVFDLRLIFDYCRNPCDKCHHTEKYDWEFWFCNTSCMFSWLKDKDIEAKGFPCQDCINWTTGESTGFVSGFDTNPVCITCKGSGRVPKQTTWN